MASKTTPSKKSASSKSSSSKTSSRKSTEPEVTTLKFSSADNLSQSGTIGYEISVDDAGTIFFGLTSNSGAGFFSKTRVSFTSILDALKDFEKQFPLTSLALKAACPPNSSINNWSFMLAVLLAEGVVENHPDHPRRYRLCNVDAYLKELEKLKSQHSAPAKGRSTAKAKAATSMKTPRKKPATGK